MGGVFFYPPVAGGPAHARWLTMLMQDVRPGAVPVRIHELGSPPGGGPSRRVHAFSVDEVVRLHRAAEDAGAFARCLLRLLFTTGLRVGGVARLPLPTAPHVTTVLTTEKGGAIRPVTLAPVVWEAIREWWTVRPPPADGREPRYLFPSRRSPHRPVSTSHLKVVFRRLCRAAGVVGPHAHIHTTRHTLAVALHLAGARLVDIAALLGHANVNTTYAVYSMPTHEQLLACLRAGMRILRPSGVACHGCGGTTMRRATMRCCVCWPPAAISRSRPPRPPCRDPVSVPGA